MFNLPTFFAALSALSGLGSFVPYLRDIFVHKTQPHIYSWLVWALLQATGAIAMISSGASWGITPLVTGATLCVLVFILSFKFGSKNITVFDSWCLAAALLIFVFYLLTHQALLSVVLISIVDVVGGFLPTLRKAFVYPDSETAATYFLGALAYAFALGALKQFNLTNTLYLAVLVVVDAFCAGLIIIRRRQLANHA